MLIAEPFGSTRAGHACFKQGEWPTRMLQTPDTLLTDNTLVKFIVRSGT
jgi:hypothetical protein